MFFQTHGGKVVASTYASGVHSRYSDEGGASGFRKFWLLRLGPCHHQVRGNGVLPDHVRCHFWNCRNSQEEVRSRKESVEANGGTNSVKDGSQRPMKSSMGW
jgi:hypothetical protein